MTREQPSMLPIATVVNCVRSRKALPCPRYGRGDVMISDVMISDVMISDVMISDVMISDVMISDVMMSDVIIYPTGLRQY